MDPEKVTYFAETDSRNERTPFGIKSIDRLKHVYVIGKTGMGKSTLLENMAIQDIQSGEGMAFIDPHGSTADKLLEYVPEERIKDVLYFAPFDIDHPVSFNIMEDIGGDKRHLVLNGLMSAFKKLFGEDSFSDRMQYILQNTILALLEYPGSTLLGVNKMLSEKVYRNKVIANITDSSVKTYWTKEYAGYTERFAAEAIPAIQNKIGQFTSNPLVRNIIGQPKSSFDIRQIMDEQKILIVNLSKGRVGEGNANLLGSMFITKIYLAAMSRADASSTELKKLPNFYLYVDEFQSFANKSFADILSEARKYKLNLTIAHQYIEQMEEEVRDAVFGNVGTMITFRVGAYDAEVLEKEFAPVFTAEDLVNLGSYQIYLKLMIDGIGSQPFSAASLPPIEPQEKFYVDEIKKESRRQYAKPKEVVENDIREWLAEDSASSKTPDDKRDGQRRQNDRNDRRGSQSIDMRGKKPNIRQGDKPRDNFKKDDKQIKKQFIEELPNDDFKPLSAISKKPEPARVSLKSENEKQNNQRKPDPKKVDDLKSALSAVVKDNSSSNTHTPKPKPRPQKNEEKKEPAMAGATGPTPDELKKLLGI